MIGGYQEPSNDSFPESPDSPEVKYFSLNPVARLELQHLTDRQFYLLQRFQLFGWTFGRLGKMWRDIQLYGASRNQYAHDVAWKEVFE